MPVRDSMYAVPLAGISPAITQHYELLLQPPGWTRLEPQGVSGDPSPGLEARLHDPFWMLARQWQFGEFQGDDAGTPVTASIVRTEVPMIAWRAIRDRPDRAGKQFDGSAHAIRAGQRIDPHIEREPVGKPPGLRARIEAARLLDIALAESGWSSPPDLPALYPPDLSNPSLSPADLLLCRRCADAEEIAKDFDAGEPSWFAVVPPAARQALGEWLAWYRCDVSPSPAQDTCWIPERLEYQFAVGVGEDGDRRTYQAPCHDGAEIDWFTFDHWPDSTADAAWDQADVDGPRASSPPGSAKALVSPLRYAGMPSDRLWQFEDAAVNFGAMEVQPNDPARLCLIEFAIMYSCDWFMVPLDAPDGALTTVAAVEVTDTFGHVSRIERASDGSPGKRFRMFENNDVGKEAAVAGLLLPPSAAGVLQGRPLEHTVFMRDEMANMAWAVERSIEDAMGRPYSRAEEALPEQAPREPAENAELVYTLQTPVQACWIPMVPVVIGADGKFVLRKATLTGADQALGRVVAGQPYDLRDEEIPRGGVSVQRVPALTREADGRTVRWVQRHVSYGIGEAFAQLRFDEASPPRRT